MLNEEIALDCNRHFNSQQHRSVWVCLKNLRKVISIIVLIHLRPLEAIEGNTVMRLGSYGNAM